MPHDSCILTTKDFTILEVMLDRCLGTGDPMRALISRKIESATVEGRPVNLARFDRSRRGWMTSDDDLWWIAEHLVEVPHTRLLTAAMTRKLSRVDRRSLRAGLVGYRQH